MNNHMRRQQQQQRHQQQQSQVSNRNRHVLLSINPSNYQQSHSNQSYQQNRRRSSSCSSTIFYSWLIAIFSSFLVVLGIYFSLTRFNIRFLYISLAGLLIEAISACLYCISNIHKSKLAQYKQATDDLETTNTPGRQRQSLVRHQQARNVTHILTNRTLNQAAIPTIISNNNSTDSIVNNDTSSGRSVGQSNDNSSNIDFNSNVGRNNSDNQILVNNSNDNDLSHQLAIGQQQLLSSTNEQLPNSDQLTCQDLPDSSIILSTSQPQEQQHDINLDTNEYQSDEQLPNAIITTATTSGKHENSAQTSDETTIKTNDELDLISEQAVPPETTNLAAASGQPQVTNAVGQAPERTITSLSPASSSSSNRNTRNANVRRTLVMGLSGEEEVIEIDEEDLDNMSILPPSYESIATDSNIKQQPQ